MVDNYTCPYCEEKGTYLHFFWKCGEIIKVENEIEGMPSIFCCPSCNMIWSETDKEELEKFIEKIPKKEKEWYKFYLK